MIAKTVIVINDKSIDSLKRVMGCAKEQGGIWYSRDNLTSSKNMEEVLRLAKSYEHGLVGLYFDEKGRCKYGTYESYKEGKYPGYTSINDYEFGIVQFEF